MRKTEKYCNRVRNRATGRTKERGGARGARGDERGEAGGARAGEAGHARGGFQVGVSLIKFN